MFKSVGHFFAVVYQKALAVIPKAQATETTVEAVTAAKAPALLPVEKAAYAVLGEISAVLHVSGDAAKAKLTDAGLDIAVIQSVQDLLKTIPEFTAMIPKA